MHTDIIAPNFTNFNRRNFKIFKIMFLYEWHPEQMKLLREVITHSAFAVSLFVRKKNKLPITTRTVSDLTELYPRLQYYDVQTLEYRYISKLIFSPSKF
jgi:hypothetical protein